MLFCLLTATQAVKGLAVKGLGYSASFPQNSKEELARTCREHSRVEKVRNGHSHDDWTCLGSRDVRQGYWGPPDLF